jgi:putative tryptophan/tyrosine transport system substrate-binding protein
MHRRDFMMLLGGTAAAHSLAARAEQPERMRQIGWLVGLREQDPEAQSRNTVIVRALSDLGWIVGRNLHIEYRYLVGDSQRFDIQAAELVALAPDVLIANSTPATRALQQASSTIPIVFVQVLDPVGSGVVTNLARPSGNVTGFTNFEVSMGGKWLELLKEVSPLITRVALIFNRHTAAFAGILRSMETSAASLAIDISTRGVNDPTELEPAIAAAAREPGGALVLFPDIFTAAYHAQIVALAKQYKLPAVYPFRFFTSGGGLMSYGIDTPDLFRRMAGYVDQILKGAKPGDLPVQAPNKFELVINLKTARELGLEISPKLLAVADEVIE